MIYLISKEKTSDAFLNVEIQEALDYCKDLSEICIDLETTGLDFLNDKIIFLVIGDRFNQYVVDSTIDYTEFKDIIESKTIIGHNLSFDYKFLKQIGIEIKTLYDTMIAESLVHQGKLKSQENFKKEEEQFVMRVGLDKVVKRWLNKDLSKITRKSFIGANVLNYDNQQISYAAHDILYLQEIKKFQLEHLTRWKELNVLQLENKCVIPIAEMEYEGMLLNKTKWKKIYDDNMVILNNIKNKMNNLVLSDSLFKEFIPKYVQVDMFNEHTTQIDINWDSPKQCLNVFQKLFPELTSTDSNILEKYNHELIKLFLEYKELSKLVTTYGIDFFKYLYSDGRVHTNFTQIVNTGRVSSSQPNNQNLPNDNKYRNCFIPNYKDYVFVSSDFSSQELNLIAHDSQDVVWINALKANQDLHSICAEILFGEEWKNAADNNCEFYISKQKCKCKKHKELRNFAKTLNFGLSYGMGADKLSARLDISIKEAEILINRFFTVFPNIKDSLERSANFGTKYNYIRTLPPFNRIRWFGNEKGYGNIQRESKNTHIQGSASDMTKLALVYIWEFIQTNNLPVKLVCQVHDQIDTICHKDYAIQWQKELTMLMEKAAKVIIPTGYLKAETTISNEWSK